MPCLSREGNRGETVSEQHCASGSEPALTVVGQNLTALSERSELFAKLSFCCFFSDCADDPGNYSGVFFCGIFRECDGQKISVSSQVLKKKHPSLKADPIFGCIFLWNPRAAAVFGFFFFLRQTLYHSWVALSVGGRYVGHVQV